MSKREKWLMAIIAALVVIFAGDQLLVRPVLSHLAALDEQVAQLDKTYQQARVLVDNRDTLLTRWRAYEQAGLALDDSKLRLSVQQRLAEWSQQAGVNLTMLASGRAIKGDRFHEIQFTASGTGSLGQVVAFLVHLQNSPLPMRVLRCDITSANETQDKLALRLTLSTIRLSASSVSTAQLTGVEVRR